MKIKLSLFSILFLSVFAQLFVFSGNCFGQMPPTPNQTPKPIVRPSVKDLPVERPYVSLDLNYSILLPEPTYSNNWIFQEGKVGITVADAVLRAENRILKNLIESTTKHFYQKSKVKLQTKNTPKTILVILQLLHLLLMTTNSG